MQRIEHHGCPSLPPHMLGFDFFLFYFSSRLLLFSPRSPPSRPSLLPSLFTPLFFSPPLFISLCTLLLLPLVHGGCFINERELWLVLEYVKGGNLYEFLAKSQGPLPLDLQISFFYQAAKSINYLHTSSYPILHRDVKSLNFLVKDNTKLVLTDFGLSKAKEFLTSQTYTIGIYIFFLKKKSWLSHTNLFGHLLEQYLFISLEYINP